MGRSCLLTAFVTGWSRVPAPPAKMMPFMEALVSALGPVVPGRWRQVARERPQQLHEPLPLRIRGRAQDVVDGVLQRLRNSVVEVRRGPGDVAQARGPEPLPLGRG